MIKPPQFDKKTLQVATATLIVAAAVLIVVPTLMGILFGVLKIAVTVLIACGVCLLLVMGRRKLLAADTKPKLITSESNDSSEANHAAR